MCIRDSDSPDRLEVLTAYMDYIDAERRRGTRLHHMSRHIVGLFQGQPGAKRWRQCLTVGQASREAGREVIEHALDAMDEVNAHAAA